MKVVFEADTIEELREKVEAFHYAINPAVPQIEAPESLKEADKPSKKSAKKSSKKTPRSVGTPASSVQVNQPKKAEIGSFESQSEAEETSEERKISEGSFSLDDARSALERVYNDKSPKLAVKILQEFECSKISELPEAKFTEFVNRCMAEID